MTIIKEIVITFLITSTVIIGGYSVVNNYSPVHTIKLIKTYTVNVVTAKEGGPSEVVYKFMNALNEKDLNTALTCIDPRYERAADAIIKIIDAHYKINLKDIAEILPALFDSMQASSSSYSDFRITVNRINKKYVDDSRAVLSVTITMETISPSGNSEKEVVTDDVEVRKFSDEWRMMVR